MNPPNSSQRPRSSSARGRTARTGWTSVDTLPAAAAYLGLTADELRAWFDHGGSAGAIARLLARRPQVVERLLARDGAAAGRPTSRQRSAA